MISFVIGVFVGAAATVIILGFIAATTEPNQAPPKTKPDPDPWKWYLEDDGK